MHRWKTIRRTLGLSLGFWLLISPLVIAQDTDDPPPNTRGLSGGSR
ncbi:MAG: hypothetical protein AAF215_20590 [Cyanobacteria bacterium P01_A01_bin.123]